MLALRVVKERVYPRTKLYQKVPSKRESVFARNAPLAPPFARTPNPTLGKLSVVGEITVALKVVGSTASG